MTSAFATTDAPSTNGVPAASSTQPHEEHQYLNLIKTVIATGQHRPDRTGTGTIALFAPPALRFSLAGGALPLLTTKRVFFRGVLEELLWFISGSTSSLPLAAKGIHIWDGNGSAAFLASRGLGHRKEGDLGPVYGFQWRHFGATYVDAESDYTGQGVDQLAEVIRKIKEDPTDRRILLSAWNPADLHLMALPPCHMFCQFFVTLPSPPSAAEPNPRPKLSCMMYQRSCDLGLGVPFNIASYALLTHMVALLTDCEPHEFILQMGDAHVYADHVAPLQEQLEREPRPFPTLRWTRPEAELRAAGIDGFRTKDFEVVGYKPMGKIEMKMSV